MNQASVLAVNGGKPAMNVVPPVVKRTDELEETRMVELVRSGEWSWLGKHETAFCRDFANFIGAKRAMCVANGTVSMEVALLALGIVPGDEVIVPGLTWVATLQAPLTIGANAVIVDIDAETYCIDAKAVEKAITKKTKAIIPVHLFGCMTDMDAIMELAQKHNLKVVEDVAHQHGSRWKNKGAGAIGDAGSFSFQQSKILASGEGGAITANSDEVWETCFNLKHVGWKSDFTAGADKYGHNYRITEMQAVLLRGGLRHLPEQTIIRDERAQYLSKQLDSLKCALRPCKRDERVTRQAYYAFSMHYESKKLSGIPRQFFFEALGAEGLPIGGGFDPVYRCKLLNLYDVTSPVPHKKEKLQNYKELKLPVTEKVNKEEGAFLSHSWLLGDEKLMDAIVQTVEKVASNEKDLKKYADKRLKEIELAEKK